MIGYPVNLKTIQITRFDGVTNSKPSKLITLQELADEIKSLPQDIVDKINAEEDHKTQQALKVQNLSAVTIDCIHRSPGVAKAYDNVIADSNDQVNPFVILDVDTKDNEDADIQELKQKIINIPHTVLVYTTVRGGLRVVIYVSPTPLKPNQIIYRGNAKELAEEYKTALKFAEYYYLYHTGVKIHKTEARNPDRMHFINRDENVYLNLNATPLIWITSFEASKQRCELAIILTSIIEHAPSQLDSEEDWHKIVWAIENSHGMSTPEGKLRPFSRRVIHAISSQSNKYDDSIENYLERQKDEANKVGIPYLRTVIVEETSITGAQLEELIDFMTVKQELKAIQDKELAKVSVQGDGLVLLDHKYITSIDMEAALEDKNWRFRYNNFNNELEVCRHFKADQENKWIEFTTNKWRLLTDRELRLMQGDIRDIYLASKTGKRYNIDLAKLRSMVEQICLYEYNLTDEMHEWFNTYEVNKDDSQTAYTPEELDNLKISNWMNECGIELYLSGLIDVPQDDVSIHNQQTARLAKWFQRFVYLAMIWRQFEPGYPLHIVPVLIGEGGSGKSALVELMLPAHMQMYHMTKAKIHSMEEKQRIEATKNALIVEIEEIPDATKLTEPGVRPVDWESFKGYISRRFDSGTRLAYRYDAYNAKRRFIMIGTTNHSFIFPHDADTGILRRFVCLHMKSQGGIKVVEQLKNEEFKAELIKEALQLYYLGIKPDLPEDLWPIAHQTAMAAIGKSYGVESASNAPNF